MAVNQFNLKAGQRAERKLLITVAEWTEDAAAYYVTLEEPTNWSSEDDTKNFKTYYTKSGSTYTAVTGTSAPTWVPNTYYANLTTVREILGTRTEDSSIEYNADISTTTDIRGNNYTDLNKTQPQQSFDPYLILGGSRLGAKLNDIRKRNAVSELNQFTIYVITAFIGDATSGYEAERHTDCTITYTSIGGDSNVNFPIEVYLSNKITNGTVDVLADDFTFREDVTI